jgi:hypothetical protein
VSGAGGRWCGQAASTDAEAAVDASAALNSAAAAETIQQAPEAEAPMDEAAVPVAAPAGNVYDDQYDFGWEDWDQPDADTWFYDGAGYVSTIRLCV